MSEKMGKKIESSVEKSNFSLTCSLLSRYLKEKGSFGDLGLGMASRPHEATKGLFRRPTTMSLFPGVDVPADDQADTNDNVSDRNAMKSLDLDLFSQHTGFDHTVAAKEDSGKRTDTKEREKAQLTIFYGGMVLVFDNFPEDKAKDLMQLASKGCAGSLSTTSAVADRLPANCPSTSGSLPAVKPAPKPAQPNTSDPPMPIARKASLHRFLEKRKDRINAKVPYQVNASSTVGALAKPKETRSWLGLGQETPKVEEIVDVEAS